MYTSQISVEQQRQWNEALAGLAGNSGGAITINPAHWNTIRDENIFTELEAEFGYIRANPGKGLDLGRYPALSLLYTIHLNLNSPDEAKKYAAQQFVRSIGDSKRRVFTDEDSNIGLIIQDFAGRQQMVVKRLLRWDNSQSFQPDYVIQAYVPPAPTPGAVGGRSDNDVEIVVVSEPATSWREKVNVGKARTAAFWEDVSSRANKALDKPEVKRRRQTREVPIPPGNSVARVLGPDETRAGERVTAERAPTTQEWVDAKLTAVFEVTLDAASKAGVSINAEDDDRTPNELAQTLKEVAINEITAKPYQDGSTEEEYITRAFDREGVEERLLEVARNAPVARDMGSATAVGSALLPTADINTGKIAMDDQDWKKLIACRKIYIEMLEIYEKDLRLGERSQTFQLLDDNGEDASSHKAQDVKKHIDECKLKLAMLEAACAQDNFHAQRAAGAGVGAAATLVTTAGAATGIAFTDHKVAEVALDALKDAFTGNFDKLGQGLAAHNPILMAVVIGAGVGLLTMVVGILSATEVVSHGRGRADAVKEFEKLAFDEIEKGIPNKTQTASITV